MKNMTGPKRATKMDYDTIVTVKNNYIRDAVTAHLTGVNSLLRRLGFENVMKPDLIDYMSGNITVRNDPDGTTMVKINSRIRLDNYQQEYLKHTIGVEENVTIGHVLEKI